MTVENTDPYERHARRYLARLQRRMREFTHGEAPGDELARRLQKVWPQVFSAFWWASGDRSFSRAAEEIVDALLACSDGDIGELQLRRGSAEVLQLAKSLAATARQQESGNDAAFLYRVAGITLTQGRILEMTEKTGVDVHRVMGHVLEAAKRGDFRRAVAKHDWASGSGGTRGDSPQDGSDSAASTT